MNLAVPRLMPSGGLFRFWAVLCMVGSFVTSIGAAIRVENVTARLRPDGTRVVEVTFDLVALANEATARVDLLLSNDAGRSWTVVPPASSLTGDFGDAVEVGPGKRIVYESLRDRPGLSWSGVAARVHATTGAPGETVRMTLPGGAGIEFIRIPAGTFEMGSPDTEQGRWDDEGPVRTVHIDYDFYMSKYQVTQAQWTAILEKNPSRRYGMGPTFPAFYVSWDMARELVRGLDRLGLGHFRLPSEAEWEYACRAGTQTRYHFGDSLEGDDVCDDAPAGTLPGNRSDYMWYCANHGPPGAPDYAAKPVGRLRPNAFGLHDMNGNLWEWCRDVYFPNYDGAPTDGSARQGPPGSARVLRGGAWDYFAQHCRSASRNGYSSWRGYTFHGVRLVWFPYAMHSDSWFASWEAVAVADNMISFQNQYGAWPKNLNMYEQAYQGEKFTKNWGTTLDNGATLKQLRFLARTAYANGLAGRDLERAKASFLRGLDFLFKIQYPGGGFPQRYPEGHDYGDLVTFNDDLMAGALRLLRDVAEKPEFAFVDATRRARAKEGYDRGLRCTLDCQIVLDGKKTIWGGQHDPVTLEPRAARSFEPNGLCTRESAEVVHFLMSLSNPSPDVVEAIESAVTWFREAKITGSRLDRVDGDLVVVPDPEAPPLWARFHDMQNGRPMFAGMDGVVKNDISEIDRERRNGYGWFNHAGETVFAEHAEWRRRTQGK